MDKIECIDPALRKYVTALEWKSLAENASALSESPSTRMSVRLHWLSCPQCREDYSYALSVLEVANQVIIDRVAGLLTSWSKQWETETSRVGSTISTSVDDLAYKIAGLAVFGIEVQDALSFAVGEFANFSTEPDPIRIPSDRVPISKCAPLIRSLEAGVREFVFEAVQCHDLLIPHYEEQVGPARLIPPLDEEEASEYDAEQTAAEDERTSFRKALAEALASNIGAQIPGLYDIIRVSAAIHLGKFLEVPHTGELSDAEIVPVRIPGHLNRDGLEGLRSQQSDGFDSLKAGQMEIIRLIEQNGRSAAAFEPAIEAQLGGLYRRLNENTRRQLQVAEYIYSINRSEPDYSHGSVMNIALAYENELLFTVIWPYLQQKIREGVRFYDGGTQEPNRAILRNGELQKKNIGLSDFRWYLTRDQDLRNWAENNKSLNVRLIIQDLNWIIPKRGSAAHELICRLSAADEVRGWALNDGGPFLHLHPH